MKTILLLIPLFLLCSQQTLLAQHNSAEEQLIKSLSERLPEASVNPGPATKAVTYQSGQGNQAAISQQSRSLNGNSAIILQVGSYNSAILQQQGQGNRTEAKQIGAYNKYVGEVDGTANTSRVLQQGLNNSISQRINANNLEHTLIQYGNNNSIHQVETGLESKSYKIVQEGNNMNITIEQSNWSAPLSTGKK